MKDITFYVSVIRSATMRGSTYISLCNLIIIYIMVFTMSQDAMDSSYSADGSSRSLQKLYSHSTLNLFGCGFNFCPAGFIVNDCLNMKFGTLTNKLINKIKFVHNKSKGHPCTCTEEFISSHFIHCCNSNESKVLSLNKHWLPTYITVGKQHFYINKVDFNYLLCALLVLTVILQKAKHENVTSLEKFFFNPDEKYGWMFKYLRGNVSYIASVFPVFNHANTKLNKLATYSRLLSAKLPSNVSFIVLAEAGFEPVGTSLQVACQDCNKSWTITDFTSSPTEGKYHVQGCSFIKEEDNSEQQIAECETYSSTTGLESSSSLATPDLESSSSLAIPDLDEVSVKPVNENVVSTGISSFDNNIPEVTSGRNGTALSDEGFVDDVEEDSASIETLVVLEPDLEQYILNQESKSVSNFKNPSEPQIGSFETCHNSVSEQSAMQSATPSQQHTDQSASMTSEEFKVPDKQRCRLYSGSSDSSSSSESSSSSNSSGYSSDELLINNATASADQRNGPQLGLSNVFGPSSTHLKFDENFQPQPEFENCQDVQISRDKCKKNPGHYAYFPIWKFQLDYLPSNVRHPDVVQFFQHISKLTVKIVVNIVSKYRPKSDLCKEMKLRSGTGIAVAEPEAHYHTPSEEHLERRTYLKDLLHFGKKKGYIYIETNGQLVYDDLEAQNTTVEFFYDNPNKKGIVYAKGISIHHSTILGDFKSLLLCKTSDPSLIKMVRDSRKEIETLAKNLPPNIKEGMMKRIFLVNHPHGGEKVFAYGEYIMIKYKLEVVNTNEQAMVNMVRINNTTKISQNPEGLRKMLLYTADTCCGSTGAVVVSFKKTGSGNNEDIVLDLWMHGGVEKKHGLNASIMRVLTSDDIARHGEPTTARPSIQDDMNAEADRAANQVISCPVFTVSQPPTHPAYAAFRKRLESFPNPFTHIHSAEDLANAGFFYGGYGDCVRCFQCGLGLRSWRPGDNIHEEHGKNRPDCRFLQLKLREAGISDFGFQRHHQQNSGQSAVENATNLNADTGIHQNHQRGNQESESSMDEEKQATLSTQNEFTHANILYNSSLLMPQRQEITVQTALLHNAAVQHSPRSSSVAALNKHSDTQRNSSFDILEKKPDATPRSSPVAILEKEQAYLKQILMCKVCFKNQVKDLFLPCGELVSCVDCSRLLTHCPSCNQKIIATVTTYFS